MNLSPWKYRNINQKDGGPVRDIALREIAEQETFLSMRHFEALAYLRHELFFGERKSNAIYGDATGTGTGSTKTDAIYRAISEAIERWALLSSRNSDEKAHFGFDVDASSTGMAAFPGLLNCEARSHAFFEAVERWTICAWWEGLLKPEITVFPEDRSKESFGLRAEIVLRPLDNAMVVILTAQSRLTQRNVYGFAAGKNRDSAFQRALIELDRNSRVLDSVSAHFFSKIDDLEELHEKRLVWFASEDGKYAFDARLADSMKLKANRTKPVVIVDREIPGPWRKYAHVWRTLFEPASQAFQENRLDYFLF